MSAPENTADLILRLCEPAGRIGGVASVPTELLEEAIGALAALQAAHDEAVNEGVSLRTELALLLGPRKPREGVTRNEQWIAAVSEVLSQLDAAEAAVERMRQALEEDQRILGSMVRSPDFETILLSPALRERFRKAVRQGAAALAAVGEPAQEDET